MMNKRKTIKITDYSILQGLIVLLALLGVFMIMGCSGPEGPAEISDTDETSDDSDFRVTRVDYMIMNVSEASPALVNDICDEDDSEITNCYWFQIGYEGNPPDIDTLKTTFKFEDQSEFHWERDGFIGATEDDIDDIIVADFNKLIIDTDTQKILVRGLHSRNTTSPTLTQYYQNALPLGDLSVDIEFFAGSSENPRKKTVSGPEDIEEATFIYTQDPSSSDTETMIEPAVISAGDERYKSQIQGIVRLQFSVYDSRAKFYQVWFFDENDRLIAMSDRKGIDDVDGSNEAELILENNDIYPMQDGDGEVDLDEVFKFSILLTDTADADENLFIVRDGSISFTPLYAF